MHGYALFCSVEICLELLCEEMTCDVVWGDACFVLCEGDLFCCVGIDLR